MFDMPIIIELLPPMSMPDMSEVELAVAVAMDIFMLAMLVRVEVAMSMEDISMPLMLIDILYGSSCEFARLWLREEWDEVPSCSNESNLPDEPQR